jgi:hypothetical protein
MRFVMMALLLSWTLTAAATEMWRWVDENGVVHFSDRPRPGAERVDMRPAQTFTAPEIEPRRPAVAEPEQDGEEPATARYNRLAILSPDDGETLWNIAGELTIQVDVDPALRSNHGFLVYLNGQRVGSPHSEPSFTIGDVTRGEHTLRVAIVDERGRERASSNPVVFYVHQTSVQNPVRQGPVRPQPRPRN